MLKFQHAALHNSVMTIKTLNRKFPIIKKSSHQIREQIA